MTTPETVADPFTLAPPRPPLAARLGTVAYTVWALLHLQAAWGVYQLGRHAPASMVQGGFSKMPGTWLVFLPPLSASR